MCGLIILAIVFSLAATGSAAQNVEGGSRTNPHQLTATKVPLGERQSSVGGTITRGGKMGNETRGCREEGRDGRVAEGDERELIASGGQQPKRGAEAPPHVLVQRPRGSGRSRARSRAAIWTRATGATASGALSLLRNPLFVAPAVAVAALMSRGRRG